MGYIYLITNKINGKKYVGQTLCADVEIRWDQHRKVKKSCMGRYIYNTYKKYGIENFKFQIICICFDEDTDKYEDEYIKKYNTLVPNGYNLKGGGSHGKHHPETLKKMSESLKGRKIGPMSETQKEMIRQRMLGTKNPKSESTREKLSKIAKENHKNGKYDRSIMTEEAKRRQLEGLAKGRTNARNKKKVNKYDVHGNYISSYESISHAAREHNMKTTGIRNVCKGEKHYKTAGGFIWKFAEE